MAVFYGSTPSNYVLQQRLNVGTAAWVPLQAGSAPLNNRRHVRLQLKSPPGLALAVEYANATIVNDSKGRSSATFTAPTTGASGTTVIPGNTIYVEPIGDKVAVYGRLVKKKGETDNSITVIVTEYA